MSARHAVAKCFVAPRRGCKTVWLKGVSNKKVGSMPAVLVYLDATLMVHATTSQELTVLPTGWAIAMPNFASAVQYSYSVKRRARG